MTDAVWLCYEFPGDDRARISLAVNRDWDSVSWAYYTLRNVAINGQRPDRLSGFWYCEDRP